MPPWWRRTKSGSDPSNPAILPDRRIAGCSSKDIGYVPGDFSKKPSGTNSRVTRKRDFSVAGVYADCGALYVVNDDRLGRAAAPAAARIRRPISGRGGSRSRDQVRRMLAERSGP